jgi:predicted nucleotidyltransferase component of viral defense system
MPSSSEFITFVAEKSGIKKPNLIEKDLIIHTILKRIYSTSPFAENYLFKGGSCLVKCYFGYYRFSVDLDFTWRNQKAWNSLGSKELRKRLLVKIDAFGSLLEKLSKEINLEFKNDPKNKRYFEFGGGSRMVTFKLWKNSELIKIQVNYVEEILFSPKKVVAKTLLEEAEINKDEEAYFEEFLDNYRPLNALAYDEKEILCEKVRAILTRRAQKLRDFYDLYMLDKSGFKADKLRKEIIKKTKTSLQYKKYRESLEKNRKSLEVSEAAQDSFERDLLLKKPKKDYETFLKDFTAFLKNVTNNI